MAQHFSPELSGFAMKNKPENMLVQWTGLPDEAKKAVLRKYAKVHQAVGTRCELQYFDIYWLDVHWEFLAANNVIVYRPVARFAGLELDAEETDEVLKKMGYSDKDVVVFKEAPCKILIEPTTQFNEGDVYVSLVFNTDEDYFAYFGL